MRYTRVVEAQDVDRRDDLAPFSTQNVAKRVMPVMRHAGRSE